MGWRHRESCTSTGYRYDAPVHQSYNEVRLTPRTDTRQNVIVSRVETTPADPALPLHRLLGHRGHRVRPARPAQRAGRRRDVRGGDRATPQPPVKTATWEDLRGGRGPRPARPRCWSSPPTSAATRSWRVARVLRKETTPVDAVHAACRVGARAPDLPARAPPACTPRRWRRGRPAGASARTTCTSRCCCCARWASRPATSRATCCPKATPRSGRP